MAGFRCGSVEWSKLTRQLLVCAPYSVLRMAVEFERSDLRSSVHINCAKHSVSCRGIRSAVYVWGTSIRASNSFGGKNNNGVGYGVFIPGYFLEHRGPGRSHRPLVTGTE